MRILLHLLLLLFELLQFGKGEISSVQNDTHILCITQNKNPIYITPLQITDSRNTSLFLENEDPWNLVNSKNAIVGPILDKRWEDLATIYDDYYRVTSASSFSFSVYEPEGIEFFIDDDEYLDYFLEKNRTSFWYHYTVVVKDGNTYFFEHHLNDTATSILRRNINDFIPVQIVVKTYKKTYWKIHDYLFREAREVSLEPTSLSLSSQNQPCLMIYASLCEHCCLEVETDNNQTRICHKKTEVTNSWQAISIDSTDEVKLSRNTIGERSDGYWGIDIRQCSRLSSTGEYINEFTFNSTNNINSTCEILGSHSDSAINYKGKRNVRDNTLKCNAGRLGNNCDIQCEELLGSERKYCEQHKLCENKDCSCSWGFTGSRCSDPCQNGYWGLSCKERCRGGCPNCDKITGACKNSDIHACPAGAWGSLCEQKCEKCHICDQLTGECPREEPVLTSGWFWWGIPLIAVLMILKIVLLLLYCRRRSKVKSDPETPDTTTSTLLIFITWFFIPCIISTVVAAPALTHISTSAITKLISIIDAVNLAAFQAIPWKNDGFQMFLTSFCVIHQNHTQNGEDEQKDFSRTCHCCTWMFSSWGCGF